ncbi:MAG: ABC transporter ATP-binding protein [Gemmatimonadetes bacterium]|nr:ABC transporter ATP-binding protein [Gemmatimonadota bacterium]
MRDLLVVEGVTKSFVKRRSWSEVVRRPFHAEHVAALREVSVSVREGEFFGLLGANGAGKTTLMKVIATLMLPDAGRVSVDGADAVRDPVAVRGSVALSLASERGLYWRLNARENLRVFAVLSGVPDGEVSTRIEEALGAVGLADTGLRMVSEFSSGMVQRLLIARALLARPRVLLLDEPTRSLDPITARDFRAFLRRELTNRGCAVLLATHNADEAFDLCDRVAVLERGRVLATGRAHDLVAAIHGRRFAVETTPEGEGFLLGLVGRGLVLAVARRDLPGAPPPGGWTRVVVSVAGEDIAAAGASLVAALVGAGHAVASCAPEGTSLADLIQAVVANADAGVRT